MAINRTVKNQQPHAEFCRLPKATAGTCCLPRTIHKGLPMSNRYNHHLVGVRATRKLKVDGFPSSRGALHGPRHGNRPSARNPAAVGQRPRGPFGAGASGCVAVASRCCFLRKMQTHYLSATASGALLLKAPGHKPAGETSKIMAFQNVKLLLGISGFCWVSCSAL